MSEIQWYKVTAKTSNFHIRKFELHKSNKPHAIWQTDSRDKKKKKSIKWKEITGAMEK